ncbi:hypothetical protein HHL17_18500 [Chitinophaga sp. G-6-1-13]|uniref:Uncharacterized protein n=1 Tax=Chitinophaga fulva TaxID=2728842 RepID=A0A848GMM8_9BACT|nr:hypothetical protein [Chitinophaga fulva]NML39197.1 hypothetical protein [Chitinophaga fulva]
MMEYTNLSPSLQAAIEKAENIAIEQIQSQRDFEPFILCGELLDEIKRIKTRDTEEILEAAEEIIEDIDDSETAVLVYQDNIMLNDGTFEAIVCQIYNVDEDFGYSFGQIYRINEGKISFLNKRVFLGEVRNLLVF